MPLPPIPIRKPRPWHAALGHAVESDGTVRGLPLARASSQSAWLAGIGLFALEGLQSVALLPLLLRWMPANDVAFWTTLTAGLGLVNAAAAAYTPPLVRRIAVAAKDDRTAGSPANWHAMLAWADRTGLALLLLLQAALACALLLRSGAITGHAVATLLVFMLAMMCRLLAYNRFILLNGLGHVGKDKMLLVAASAATFIAMLALGRLLGSPFGLALASLFGSAALALGARRVEATLRAPMQLPAVDRPDRRQMIGLWVLSLAGYLNLGTDILVSSHLLPQTQQVSYAFWSRLLLMLLLPIGLYTQIRFPVWAGASRASVRREMQLGAVGLMTLPLLILAGFELAARSSLLGHLCLLSHWTVAAMACTTALAAGTLISGQMSTARGAFGFLWASVGVSGLAPLLSVLAGIARPEAESFVLGYLVANAALFWINRRHALQVLQEHGR